MSARNASNESRDIGHRLYQWRTKDMNNAPQKEIADGIGINRVTYSYYENGHDEIKASDILKICEKYGVSSDYLLGLTEQPSLKNDDKIASQVTYLTGDAIDAIQKHICAEYGKSNRINYKNIAVVLNKLILCDLLWDGVLVPLTKITERRLKKNMKVNDPDTIKKVKESQNIMHSYEFFGQSDTVTIPTDDFISLEKFAIANNFIEVLKEITTKKGAKKNGQYKVNDN